MEKNLLKSFIPKEGYVFVKKSDYVREQNKELIMIEEDGTELFFIAGRSKCLYLASSEVIDIDYIEIKI